MHPFPQGWINAIADTAEEVAVGVADEKLAVHVAEWHLPPRRTAPLQAVPYANRQVPDALIARVIEMLEEEGVSLLEIAHATGIGISLLERALVDFKYQYRRWLVARA